MPTTPTTKTYKIRITPERVLGPLDFERVKALVMKGRIQGQEPTSVAPFNSWSPFASFPELSDLLLRKLETDTGRKHEEPKAAEAPGTKSIARSQEATKTMANEVEEPSVPVGNKPKSLEDDLNMPTLLNIKAPEKQKEDNPDLEKTMVFVPAVSGDRDVGDGATKIMTVENVEKALANYDPAPSNPLMLTDDGKVKRGFFGLGKPVDPDEYVAEDGKRRLMSRNTAALLALGILMIAIWQAQEEDSRDPANLFPRRHAFPYIEVNVPPRLGVDADPAASADLTERGQEVIGHETPSSYIRAMREFFYKAVGRNPKNVDAKALLASVYIRLSETIPRDKRLFDTLDKLLFPGPPKNQWTPDYVVARAEYYQMLNRYDQAQEIIDDYLKIRPTPEVLYQRAKIAYERRELDTALNMIAKAIPPEKLQKANPRHLLLYANLLEKKGQKEGALSNLQRLKKESISYGPGVLAYADFFLRNGKPKDAIMALQFLINHPGYLEGMQRSEAFAVTARAFESVNMMEQAYRFAKAAYKDHYNQDEAEELLFRIKSKIPQYKDSYTFIVQARQQDKAKVTDRAISLYVQALERNRRDAIPFMMLARLYEEKGDVYEAIDRYQKALFDTPEKPIEAAINLARIYIDRFDLEKAKNMINRAEQMALGTRSRFDQVSYLKALIQLKMRRTDLAEVYFDKALGRGSRYIDLYLQMGDLETERKNEKLAEFYYSIALRYEPFHPKAMLGVALARFHLDSPSRAVSFLKDKLNSQPNSAAIMTNLAIIYLRSGDQLSGKNYLQNAIRSDSKYAEAFRLLGDLTKDEGNRQTDYSAKRHSYRYALASYEMYSKLAPNDPEGYKATADLYFDIRDLGAAAKNYHKVIQLTENYPDVRLRLAQISRNGGDSDQAMKWLFDEIKRNPKSDAAHVELGNIYMAKKDFQSATKEFTEAAHINEKNSDALFGLGVVYHLQGSYDNALSLFTRVIKLDPLKADVYWQMGLIYQKQSNRVKAMQAFTNFKGIVREPAAISRADEKIRELSVK
ncbi:MAG TPA: tetratricopeptide repeat protein [Bdellovibrionota bacterium]|jgi:tetratricopeptide (TPR) repeat protein